MILQGKIVPYNPLLNIVTAVDVISKMPEFLLVTDGTINCDEPLINVGLLVLFDDLVATMLDKDQIILFLKKVPVTVYGHRSGAGILPAFTMGNH